MRSLAATVPLIGAFVLCFFTGGVVSVDSVSSTGIRIISLAEEGEVNMNLNA